MLCKLKIYTFYLHLFETASSSTWKRQRSQEVSSANWSLRKCKRQYHSCFVCSYSFLRTCIWLLLATRHRLGGPQAWCSTATAPQGGACPASAWLQSPGMCRCLSPGQGLEVLQGQAGLSEVRWLAQGGTGRSTVILAIIHCHADLELDITVVLVPGQRRWHWYHPPLLPTSSGSRKMLGSRAKNEVLVHVVTATPADCTSYRSLIYPAAY